MKTPGNVIPRQVNTIQAQKHLNGHGHTDDKNRRTRVGLGQFHAELFKQQGVKIPLSTDDTGHISRPKNKLRGLRVTEFRL